MSAELRRQLAAGRIVERLAAGQRKPRNLHVAMAAAAQVLPEGDIDPNDAQVIEAGVAKFAPLFDYLLEPAPEGSAKAAELARIEKLTATERAAELQKLGIA